MAPKKDAKKTAPAKKAEAETTITAPQEAAQEAPSTNAVMNRLSQQFNLLTILIVALFLFQAYTFYQVKDIQKNGTVAGGPAQESPLSEENLLAYADEIGLDKKQYEQCMADEATASVVTSDMEEAANNGVQGTPGFFINGRFLGGAFPIETFREIIDAEIAGTASSNCEDYSEELQQYCADPETAAFKPEPVEIAIGNAPVIGPENAKVTIIEYSDFECPFCARAYATVNQIKSEYPNDVRIVYKHLPLTNIHPNAQRAAEASVCAQKQGKFWEMHDKLFESQGV